MSKVISFSISDRYLSQVKSLYPSLTDNLAVKQFVTDRLDSSLSSSLDDSLDGILDDKVKTIIETSLDGILDERLDDAVKKSIGELTERLSRLESRLDDSLDGKLDAMEQLLKLQRECSIATSPIPTIEETSPLPPSPDEPVRPATAIETVPKIETLEDSLDNGLSVERDSLDSPALEAIESVTVEDVEPDSTIETGPGAIEKENRETSPTIETGEGMNAAQSYRYLAQKKVEVSERTLSNWVNCKKIPMTDKGDKVSEYLILRDKLYYPKD